MSLASYLKLDDELTQLLHRRREIDRELTQLENEIHQRETRYLDQTPDGNVSVGFHRYMAIAAGAPASSSSGAAAAATSQSQQSLQFLESGGLAGSALGGGVDASGQQRWVDGDRVFSSSSTTFRKVSVSVVIRKAFVRTVSLLIAHYYFALFRVPGSPCKPSRNWKCAPYHDPEVVAGVLPRAPLNARKSPSTKPKIGSAKVPV